MELNSCFTDFLREIRPTKAQKDDYKSGHTTLRQRLMSDEFLKDFIVATFIQGSYRRATAIRAQSGKRADVDVVVVTRLSREEYPIPQAAMDLFIPFLDQFYKGKYTANDRSFAIELSYVDLDLVITSAPTESQLGILKSTGVTSEVTPVDAFELQTSGLSVMETKSFYKAIDFWEKAAAEPGWKTEPLYIPDRKMEIWERTHPLAQIEWTWEKNKLTNVHYVNVVKSLKWWRRILHPETKYPKGYPVEHMIGVCCPNGIQSVAEGVTYTLENIVSFYRTEGEKGTTPWLPDHGVPEHNVFARVSGDDFATFYDQVRSAAIIARSALDMKDADESATEWQKLFGSKFPEPKVGNSDTKKSSNGEFFGGYSERQEKTEIRGGRFG